MLLQDLKIKFIEALRQEYPAQEVNTFFNFLAEAYLGLTRIEVALSPEKKIGSGKITRFEEAIDRLLNHEPIQYIIGETEFFGLPIKVNKKVLVPRPETEELVEWILSDAKKQDVKPLRILDIGTGSGCIAISLAKKLPGALITAIDVSVEALGVAKENAALNKVKIEFLEVDILRAEKLQDDFDIIVSNPPYVRELEKADMKPNVLKNEPSKALFVKDDNPLLFYDKITKLAKKALPEKGKLYFEINQYLGNETGMLLKKEGFNTELRKDIFGNNRMLKGIYKNRMD